MTRADMVRVCEQFCQAAIRGAACGFDMLELHMAHGYLLACFLSPLTNQRTDEYGGELANRLRFPLEVLTAVRAEWPAERPLSVRLSASDWAEDGLTEADLLAIARALKASGADLLDISIGPDRAVAAARVRAHVADAILGPGAQRRRHPDHRRRQHLRGRSRQRHHRRWSRRSVRDRAAAPGLALLDVAGRCAAGL